MSDYLSTLAARSLRREPACEPRRAQMFEPRQETPGAGITEAVYEGPPGAETLEETFEGVAPDTGAEAHARPLHTTPSHIADEGIAHDFHASPRHTDAHEAHRPPSPTSPLTTPHDTLQIPDALQTARPQTSQDVPSVREKTTPRVARLALTQAVSGEPRPHEPDSLPTAVTETGAAGETPAANTLRAATVTPHTPSVSTPHAEQVADSPRPFVPTRRSSSRAATQTPPPVQGNPLSSESEPGHVVASADDSVPALNPRTLTSDVKTSSASSARPAYVSHRPGDSPAHEGQKRGAVDEEGREQTPPSVRRASVEPPALTGSTTIVDTNSLTVVDLEVVPQPNTPKLPQPAEASTRTDLEARPGGVLEPPPATAATRVRPVASRPPASNALPSLLPTTAEHIGPVLGAGPGGVRASAREGVTQSTPPIIEVTIGRIEVRALTPPAAPPPPQRERHEPPKMSLDDYLRAQGGGRR